MNTRMLLNCLLVCGLLVLTRVMMPSHARAQRFYQCEEGEVPDLKVWAAESPGQADWWVCFTYDAGDRVGNGVVFQTVKREDADFALAFVDDPKDADFSLWIVEEPAKAGWRNKKKMPILDKYIKPNEQRNAER